MGKVSVIGHGYVGRQMARMLSRAHDVEAYDINKDHAFEDRDGYSFTYDRADVAEHSADLAVVCVPTPMREDGSCDTRIVEDVCSWVSAPLVVIKSTVWPGFTSWMNDKDREAAVNEEPWRSADRFHFSPEYAGEPLNHVPPQYPDPRDSSKHDFCIVGGPQASRVLDFFAACMATSARYAATDSTTAELCKYMENAYFATKIMFCTEFAQIASRLGVDYKELRHLWTLDSRVDPDHTMVFPDRLGFGGKCLPKDLSAIVEVAHSVGMEPMLLSAVQRKNNLLRSSADYDVAAQREAAE